jgi:hypothetical protein
MKICTKLNLYLLSFVLYGLGPHLFFDSVLSPKFCSSCAFRLQPLASNPSRLAPYAKAFFNFSHPTFYVLRLTFYVI